MKLRTKSIILLAIIIALIFLTPVRKFLQVQMNKVLMVINSPNIESPYHSLSDEDWESFRFVDLDGNQINFSESKGKVIFINLWATWCPPCVAEMPSIQKLYDRYKDKVEFLMFSDESVNDLQKFLNKKGYTFPVHLPISKLPELIQTNSIPKTVIIDKEGKIRISELGATNWNSDRIHQLMDELIGKYTPSSMKPEF